jgi:hypothetical protein
MKYWLSLKTVASIQDRKRENPSDDGSQINKDGNEEGEHGYN